MDLGFTRENRKVGKNEQTGIHLEEWERECCSANRDLEVLVDGKLDMNLKQNKSERSWRMHPTRHRTAMEEGNRLSPWLWCG